MHACMHHAIMHACICPEHAPGIAYILACKHAWYACSGPRLVKANCRAFIKPTPGLQEPCSHGPTSRVFVSMVHSDFVDAAVGVWSYAIKQAPTQAHACMHACMSLSLPFPECLQQIQGPAAPIISENINQHLRLFMHDWLHAFVQSENK